jgi:hypothetical protein
MFLFSRDPRPPIRPTQPPIQWVHSAALPGGKAAECTAERSTPSSAEVRNVGAIPPLSQTFLRRRV